MDARLASVSAVGRETVAFDSVLAAMADAKTRIVILDACRNNPFVRSMRGAARANVRSGGLGTVASGEGLLVVAYAAAAGDMAADSDRSENSLYDGVAGASGAPGGGRSRHARQRGDGSDGSGRNQSGNARLTGDLRYAPPSRR